MIDAPSGVPHTTPLDVFDGLLTDASYGVPFAVPSNVPNSLPTDAPNKIEHQELSKIENQGEELLSKYMSQ